jgi:hypothetical protein
MWKRGAVEASDMIRSRPWPEGVHARADFVGELRGAPAQWNDVEPLRAQQVDEAYDSCEPSNENLTFARRLLE